MPRCVVLGRLASPNAMDGRWEREEMDDTWALREDKKVGQDINFHVFSC